MRMTTWRRQHTVFFQGDLEIVVCWNRWTHRPTVAFLRDSDDSDWTQLTPAELASYMPPVASDINESTDEATDDSAS